MDQLRRIGLWDNIPEVLKNQCRWAMATLTVTDPITGKLDKAPRSPTTGKLLSSNSDEGWVTFDEIVASAPPAIGFRITEDDSFIVIDCDKRNIVDENTKKLYNLPQDLFSKNDRHQGTYIERSLSGEGYHVIMLGDSGHNRASGPIEVYRRNHFVITTGDIIEDAPIREGGVLLGKLLGHLPDRVIDEDPTRPLPIGPMRVKDEVVLRNMFAEGGFHDKSGKPRGQYLRNLYMNTPVEGSDVSTLEMELACAIVNHTRNPEQFYRVFRESALYRGDRGGKSGYTTKKAYDDDYLMGRTFHKAVRLWETRTNYEENYMEAVQSTIEKSRTAWQEKSKPKSIITYDQNKEPLPPIEVPPGLVGDIATYMFNTAYKPMWEAGIAGALAIMATYAGRHYNFEGTGLGLYLLLAGGTGRGKETATKGTQTLMRYVEEKMPISECFIAGGSLSSGQAGQRMLAMGTGVDDFVMPSKLLIPNEIGTLFNNMLKPSASEHLVTLKKFLLDVYSKGSWESRLAPMVYSKKEDRVESIVAPNLTILGDMTPETLPVVMSEENINSGFIPRWLLIEHRGRRPKSNFESGSHGFPTEIVDRLHSLAATVIRASTENRCVPVGVDDAARELLEKFDSDIDDLIEKIEDGEVTNRYKAQIWNRSALSVKKVAALLAIGCNHITPSVTVEHVKWAIALVERSATSMEQHSSIAQERREEHRVRMVYEFVNSWFFEYNTKQKKAMRALDWHIEQCVLPRGVIFEQVGTMPEFQMRDYFEQSSSIDRLFDSAITSLVKRGFLLQEKMDAYAERNVIPQMQRGTYGEFLYRLNERGIDESN